MCFAAVCFSRKLTKEELKNAEKVNSDGGGIAYVKKGVIHVEKGLTAEQLYEISQREQLPQLIHLRLRSAGGVGAYYCHPFVISTSTTNFRKLATKNPVIIHNGHVSEYEALYYLTFEEKPKNLSDTQAVAKILALKKDFNILNFLGGKFAILFTNKKFKLYGDWTNDNGVYVSNDSHKPVKKILAWDSQYNFFYNEEFFEKEEVKK